MNNTEAMLGSSGEKNRKKGGKKRAFAKTLRRTGKMGRMKKERYPAKKQH